MTDAEKIADLETLVEELGYLLSMADAKYDVFAEMYQHGLERAAGEIGKQKRQLYDIQQAAME